MLPILDQGNERSEVAAGDCWWLDNWTKVAMVTLAIEVTTFLLFTGSQ